MATQAEMLAHVGVLLHRDLGQVGAEDVGEQPVVGLDVVDDLVQVVGDVAQEQAQLPLGDGAALGARWSSCRGSGERRGRPPELQHLALEPVDRGRESMCSPEKTRVSISSRSRADLDVDRAGSVSTTLSTMACSTDIGPSRSRSGSASRRLAQPDERAGLPAPHRDDEAVADEDHELAGLDVGGLLEVAQRLEDDEHRGVVELDLGALATLDGVLDGQRVELAARRRPRRTRPSWGP